MKMKWKCIHELKVLTIYKRIKAGEEETRLCKELSMDQDFVTADISEGSIRMKVQNNKFLDSGEGLANASRKNREVEVFEKYRFLTIEQLEKKIGLIRRDGRAVEGG